MSKSLNSRAQAAKILAPVLKSQASLDLSSLPTGSADRGLISEFCYGTLRFYPRLRLIADALLSKGLRDKDTDIDALLLLGLYQVGVMQVADHAAVAETVEAARQLNKNWACALLNGCLRRYLRDRESIEASLQADSAFQWCLPPWLLNSLQKAWPDDWQQIATSAMQQAPMTLRVNQRHGDRDSYLQKLDGEGLPAIKGELSNMAIRLDQAAPVNALPGFERGEISVQDEGAQLAAILLAAQPGQRVLDACAAPGGKACHILESATDINLLALDIDELRLGRVRENLQRLSLQAAVKVGDASAVTTWWDGEKFDRILVDAPCSGTGVMNRHPDIKLLRTPSDVRGFAKRQLEMLIGLWACLAPGGQLLYSTCSVLREENGEVVQAFLQSQTDAEEIPLDIGQKHRALPGNQLLPIAGRHDGFYYALMRKQISD